MADDLEVVLRETGFHSRMLGDLLREAFGSDLSTSQETLSSVTPELLAKLAGEDEPGTGTLPSSSGGRRRQWSWQRGVSLIASAAVTATLAGLLLARGGGANSYARVGPAAPPAAKAIAPSVDPLPPAAVAPPKPAAAAEPAAADTPSPAAPGGAVKAAAGEQAAPPESGSQRSKRSHRHGSRRQTQEDRVVRGLSIDPFAESQRPGKR
jgi:hypothetical protein